MSSDDFQQPQGIEIPQGPRDDGVPEPEPPMGFSEILSGILLSPAVTFRRLKDRPPMGYALAIFSVVAILNYLTFSLGRDLGYLGPFKGLFGALGILSAFVLVFSQAGLFGGLGREPTLLVFLMLAGLPRVFNVAVFLLGRTRYVLEVVASLALFVWVIVLGIIALSTGVAALVYFLPLLVSVGVLILLVVQVASLGPGFLG